MTERGVVCAVDVGSTGVKAAVYGSDGALRARATVGLAVDTGAVTVQISPDQLWRSVVEAVRTCLAGSDQIPSLVAIATQMAGQTLLDREGRVIGPVLMGIDRRHDLQAGAVRDARQLARLEWWHRHHPEQLAATHRWGGVKEYLVWRATGAWVTDPSSASVSGFYDPVGLRWTPPPYLEHIELPHVLPSATRVDVLTAGAAEELGLAPDTVVICGIGDGPAASLAAGAVGPERLCVSLGTTTVVRLALDAGSAAAIPDPTPSTFVQHLCGGWYCTGQRAEGAVDLAAMVTHWPVSEIRTIGGRLTPDLSHHLAEQTGLPVRSTGAADGTLGLLLLAHHETDWLDAARRLPVLTESLPGKVS